MVGRRYFGPLTTVTSERKIGFVENTYNQPQKGHNFGDRLHAADGATNFNNSGLTGYNPQPILYGSHGSNPNNSTLDLQYSNNFGWSKNSQGYQGYPGPQYSQGQAFNNLYNPYSNHQFPRTSGQGSYLTSRPSIQDTQIPPLHFETERNLVTQADGMIGDRNSIYPIDPRHQSRASGDPTRDEAFCRNLHELLQNRSKPTTVDKPNTFQAGRGNNHSPPKVSKTPQTLKRSNEYLDQSLDHDLENE